MNLEKIKAEKNIQELLEFGIINIDKSSGPTSFKVSEFVKKTLGLRKTSHFGTLDPKVTGVLPVALNRACKLTGYFLGEDKEYVGVMKIHKEIDLKKIKNAIEDKFTGKIMQTPPVKSRVKRQERQREVKKFEILENNGQNYLFLVECQGGTYIRKLISDLGEEIGTGAHMLELRRVRAGIFKEDSCVNLYDFEKAVEAYKKGDEKFLREIIIPAEIISELFPVIKIKEKNIKKIFTGKPIHKEDVEKIPDLKKQDKVVVFCKNRFVGIYRITNEEFAFARAEFVLQPIK